MTHEYLKYTTLNNIKKEIIKKDKTRTVKLLNAAIDNEINKNPKAPKGIIQERKRRVLFSIYYNL